MKNLNKNNFKIFTSDKENESKFYISGYGKLEICKIRKCKVNKLKNRAGE